MREVLDDALQVTFQGACRASAGFFGGRAGITPHRELSRDRFLKRLAVGKVGGPSLSRSDEVAFV